MQTEQNYSEWSKKAKDLLSSSEQLFPIEKNLEIASKLNDFATDKYLEGKYDESYLLFKQAYEIYQKSFDGAHLLKAQSLNK